MDTDAVVASVFSPGRSVGVIRCRSRRTFDVLVNPAEWGAFAPRGTQGVEGERKWMGKPRDEHYDQLHDFRLEVNDKYGGVSQRLGWVGKQAVQPEINML